jgi:hypothetical protein
LAYNIYNRKIKRFVMSAILKKLDLPKDDWKTIAKHFLVVLGAAGLTYATEYVRNAEFGPYSPLVVVTLSVVLTYTQRVLANNVQPMNPYPPYSPYPYPPQPPYQPPGGGMPTQSP